MCLLPATSEVGQEAPRERLALRTEATWQQCLQRLRAASGGTKTALAREEQAAGIRHCAASALFSEDVCHLVQMRHLLFDTMHLVVSGGSLLLS